jgi:hypothetical protein
VSNLFTLFYKLFHQRKRLASALSPYDSIVAPDYLGQIEIFQIDFAGHRSLLAMKGGANNRIKTRLVPAKRPRMGFRREVQSVVDPDLFARAREVKLPMA